MTTPSLSGPASALYFHLIADERWRGGMRGVYTIVPRVVRWLVRLSFVDARRGWADLRAAGLVAWDDPPGGTTELDRRIVLVPPQLEDAVLGAEWTSPDWGPDPEVAGELPVRRQAEPDPLWASLDELRREQDEATARYKAAHPSGRGAPVFQDLDPLIGPLLDLRAREQAERARAGLSADPTVLGYDDILGYFARARGGESARSLGLALRYLADLAIQSPESHGPKVSLRYVLHVGSRAILPVEQQDDLYTDGLAETGWMKYADRWERARPSAVDVVYLDGRLGHGTDPVYALAFGVEQAQGQRGETGVDIAAAAADFRSRLGAR